MYIYNLVTYNIIYYNKIQYNTTQYNTIQYHTIYIYTVNYILVCSCVSVCTYAYSIDTFISILQTEQDLRETALTELRTGGPVQKSCTSAALCEDLCSPHPTDVFFVVHPRKKHQNTLEIG